ncbi:motility associated factor glycosyltransferase family protein [Butyrivibrio sp. WCD2001]|uniref:motility associated factor glycosyltransferase family protein n=1 Tax=Butyrivibrio sp. WCD2001 TaxID=1280681 RepID=UPI000416DF83|nr:6-hydroxymethylpterin diphosphokinase MptE-like protein [Butyrivibrio sp. WCD2001]
MRLNKDEALRKKNFDAFEKKYDYRPAIDPDEDEKYWMEESRTGKPVLFIKNGDGTNDIRMNSIYDPEYEAERWAKKVDFGSKRSIVMVLGFSVGYPVRALKKELRPDTSFYIYEPQEGLFSFVMAFIDITDLLSDQYCEFYISKKQTAQMETAIMTEQSNYGAELQGVTSPYYRIDDIFDNTLRSLFMFEAMHKNYQRNRARISFECRLYAWKHMNEALDIIKFAEAIPEGIPAVIVSAGPSLKKNVKVLDRIKNHALIVATDRAVSVLDHNNIIPDIVVSLDSQKDSSMLDGEVVKKVPLIGSFQTNIETQKKFRGRTVYYDVTKVERAFLGETVDSLGAFESGGNVASSAFSICRLLGIKTIVLIGQDLAFLDGKHHADESEAGKPTCNTLEIEGIYGGTVTSCTEWLAFRDFFERQIKMYEDMRVIDATEGGALIHGSEIMTLNEVADMFEDKTYNLTEAFAKIPKTQTLEGHERTLELMNKCLGDFDFIAKRGEEVADFCNKLLRIAKYQNIADSKVQKKLKLLDDMRMSIYELGAYSLLDQFWIQDVESIPDYTFMLRNNEEAIPILENAIKFYTHLREDAESMKEAMIRALQTD